MNGNVPVSGFTYNIARIFVVLVFLTSGLVLAQPKGENALFMPLYDGREPFESTVLCILQDELGFIWFGTLDGLVRYDGRKFKIWRHEAGENSLSHNLIYALYQDEDGFLWVGTHNGLNRYNPQNDRFETFSKEVGAPVNTKVTAITGNGRGSVWVGTWRGLMLFDGTRFKEFPHQPGREDTPGEGVIFDLAWDKTNQLWIGTENGLTRYNPQSNTFQTLTQSAIASSKLHALHVDQTGNLWAGGIGSGLFKLDAGALTSPSPQIHSYKADEKDIHALSSNAVFSIGEDSLGRIWVGTDGDGLNCLVEWDATGRPQFQKFQQDDRSGLPSNSILSFFTDQTGLLWLGSFSGPAIYNPRSLLVQHFEHEANNPNSLSHNGIWQIFEDGAGALWIGSWDGLNRYDPATGKFKVFRHDLQNPASLIHNDVLALTEYKDHLWVGTKGGLQLFDGETFKALPTSTDSDLLNAEIFSIQYDGVHSMWLSTSDGLYQYHHASRLLKHRNQDPHNLMGLGGGGLTLLFRDALNKLWLGTESGLIAIDGPQQYRIMELPGKKPYSAYVISLGEDKESRLLIGTSNGLDMAKANGSVLELEAHFSVDNGLSHNLIYGVLCDEDGMLWLSTGKGINRLNPHTGTVRAFDLRDGLMNGEYNQFAYFKDSRGLLYFGGERGVDFFQPRAFGAPASQPPVRVVTIQQNYEDMNLNTTPAYTRTIQMPYENNRITLEFTSLDFLHSERSRFAYKLEGHDEDWIPAGEYHTANFSQLAPGNYSFLVKASNIDGVWTHSPNRLTLRIPTPMTMTLWFRLLILGVIILILAMAYQWRINIIKARKLQLEKLVDQRTQELKVEKERVETLHEFVKTVNSELDFMALLKAILEKTGRSMGVEVHVARAIILDKPSRTFRTMAQIPRDQWRKSEAMTPEEAAQLLTAGAEEIHPGIFQKRPDSGGAHLILPLGIGGKINGYIVYENHTSHDAFRGPGVKLLADFAEPMVSGLIRTGLLRELQTLNEKKDEFMGAIAHDLRSPLGGILSYAELLHDELGAIPGVPDQTLEDLVFMQDATRRILGMINKLLDISAIEAGSVELHIQSLEVGGLLCELHRLYEPRARQKDIHFVLKDGPQQMIDADRSRLLEILENLVGNAIKYTHKGGEVVLFHQVEDGMLVFHVQDNGQGINEWEIKNLFTRFRTLGSKPTGGEASSGLGLAIARKIVELHGGKIWARKGAEKGMIFSFSIPLQTPQISTPQLKPVTPGTMP